MRRGVRSFLGGGLITVALVVNACAGGDAPSPRLDPSIVPTATEAASPSPEVVFGPERVVARGATVRPPEPAMVASFRAALVADHCVDRDLAAPSATDLNLVVLDRTYALPAGYVPPDLVAASAAGLGGASGTKLVRAAMVDDLAAMAAAWKAAGLTVIIDSAYRSYGSQSSTFNSWVARLGYAAALARSARPGHSEHQLGTALDLSSPGWGGRFGDWAVESPEGAWMAAHGWEYGFVMSYPAGSQASTCFSYEPWHYRWIGRNAAAELRASGLYPRQFLERFVNG